MNNTTAPLVLIVDDNDQNLRLARDVLRAAGIRTLEANSGEQGVALAREHVPDVILMDLRLPDMDGSVAARDLAMNPGTAEIPVVVCSSLAFEDEDWYSQAGFAGALAKPINVELFPEQVRAYCRG